MKERLAALDKREDSDVTPPLIAGVMHMPVRSWPFLATLFAMFCAGCSPEDISSTPSVDKNDGHRPPIARAPSTVIVPVTVSLQELQTALEAAVPTSDGGTQTDPIGGAVVDDALTWEFRRAPISVSAKGDAIFATTSVSGVVRVQGNVRLIRGDLGRWLGRLNPTNLPFSAHADLSAEATLKAAPLVTPDWSVNPGLSARGNVTEASIPIAGVTTLSVRGHIQPKLDEKLAKLIERLNDRLSKDDGLRRSAMRAWAQLCGSHRVTTPPELGTAIFLIIEPIAAHVAAPRIDGGALRLVIGVTAQTRLSDVPVVPNCTPLPNHSPAPDEGFKLEVPVSLGYATLSRALTEQVRRKPMRSQDGRFELAVENVSLKSAGSDLVVSLDLKASETRWFGASYAGTLHLRAAPAFDPIARTFRLSDVRLDPGSEASVSRHGLAARLIGPLALALIGSEVDYAMAGDLDRANARIGQAIAELRERKVPGLAVTRAEVGIVGVDDIEVQDRAVVFHVSAKGSLELAARPAELFASPKP